MAQRDVLIADDDGQVSEVLRQVFVAAGYNCLLARDVPEGLAVFMARRPPLIVTRRGMGGIELLQLIRQEDQDAAVIIFSFYWPGDLHIWCLKLGADCLWSPLNLDQLLITAERALERRQLLIERRHRQQADGQPQAHLAQRDVLIVATEEDPPTQIRDVVRQMFESAGYTCRLTGYWGRGLKAFRESRPSLVFIDLRTQVVGLAGIKLLQEIREEDPDAAVIVTSADPKIGIESLKLGAYAFLQKPIIVDELLIAAERALEHRQLVIERRQRQADT
jgi:DNA-binding NtrC family response regulator